MMHPNFYHWHIRAELKPDPSILQSRWDAAAKFSQNLTGEDACSLLRLALFGAVAPEFSKRFSGELVALEPTFLPEGNAELLRVMATAAIYSQMESSSAAADALALGLHAAAFQPDRIKPVCKELALRAAEYLALEAEQMRPTPDVGSDFEALETATEAENWADNEGAPQLISKAVLELGKTIGRIAEENQFLWWLLGRRSSLLNTRREKLSSKEYSLLAGAEAAERVDLLPPPASAESLIEEVLTHCSKASSVAIPLVDIIDAADLQSLKPAAVGAELHEICPIEGLLWVRRTGGKVDGTSLEKLLIPAKLKVLPAEAGSQYFREQMFLRGLGQLS